MINGLKLKVTSKELVDHCMKRAAYHTKRAGEKEAELPKLREALDCVKGQGRLPDSVSHMNKGGYRLDPDDPVQRLEGDITDHRNKSMVFTFFASHLFDEDYTLEENDLRRLEILK